MDVSPFRPFAVCLIASSFSFIFANGDSLLKDRLPKGDEEVSPEVQLNGDSPAAVNLANGDSLLFENLLKPEFVPVPNWNVEPNAGGP